ncbi:hypothetical protein BJY04DRAFT_199027 [Aspergillus karnatakaensis]|uniref:putative tRNA methyltransferase n=1 Tax=Aspergillus karnatakaensis TaxID=1810916 RepID=UPI003CCE2D53
MAENFQQPFQCIQSFKTKSGSKNVFVASVGSKLFCYDSESGQRLSVWPQDGADAPNANDESNPEVEGPPGKKRKVDPSSEQKNTTPALKQTTAWTNIPILTATPDGEYLVALTAEDKSIRVFQIEENSSFLELSARSMPKRPCAITFTDKNDILIGDKFGDVYSMPLIPSAEPRTVKAQREHRKVIAATNLTVHTERNLRSLQMQQEQLAKRAKNAQSSNQDSEAPAFDHNLLLGHVSLLTDVVFAKLPSPEDSSEQRSYILTGDRDEHIRVSRGPPQANITENYCFGHTAFISKLCIPTWAPEVLISGGGDPFLLIWNWASGQILQKISLSEYQSAETKEVAVRGIWASSSNSHRVIFVALEGNPTLLTYTLPPSGTLTPLAPIESPLGGNILDIESNGNGVIISRDTIRQPGSSQEWRTTASKFYLDLLRLTDQGVWEGVDAWFVGNVNSQDTVPASGVSEKEKKASNNAVYGLENLRKKLYGDEE